MSVVVVVIMDDRSHCQDSRAGLIRRALYSMYSSIYKVAMMVVIVVQS